MSNLSRKETGFALIVSMIILAVLSILVVNAVRGTALSEKMSGSYMDRTLAQQSAEQALRQGEALLLANGDLCIAGCAVPATGALTASTTTTAMGAIAWVETSGRAITLATAQATSAKYMVTLLPDTDRPAAKATAGCKAYSILGKGVGLDSRSTVILQTVSFLCPV